MPVFIIETRYDQWDTLFHIMERYPDTESLALFIKVVEAGSFAKVSREHHVPKASLSRRISQLEQFYGLQLLIRNTRHIQLTEVGKEIYQRAQSIIALLNETQSSASQTKEKPKGLLRVTAGVEYGLSVISPLVNQFLFKYPEVDVELDLTGRRVDLIYEGFDLGVRIGPLEDSSLSMRKIGSFRYGLFCSPKMNSKIENSETFKSLTIEKLRKVPTLGFTRLGNKKTWTLINKMDERTIEIRPRLSSNNYWALLNAAESGLGVAFMPTFLAKKSLNKGLIQQVLPSWSSEEIPVHFIYPSQRYLTSKVRSFIDFAIEELRIR